MRTKQTLTITSLIFLTFSFSRALGEEHCERDLARHVVCESAGLYAAELMRSRHLEAATVLQDVRTGSLAVFASSRPGALDVSTAILPLSFSKVYLAASWWDHNQPEPIVGSKGSSSSVNPALPRGVNVHETLVGGSDSAGKKIALALRRAMGSEAVLADLRRYGVNATGNSFWAYVDPTWKSRLTPQRAPASLRNLDDQEWSAALSIGETHMTITLLQVSRFLQAVGNDGVGCSPVAMRAVSDLGRGGDCIGAQRIVNAFTAKELESAFLDTVKRGTANRIANALAGTGWSIGGKTGSGGRPGAPHDQQDGCFAGLIFDSHGKARFTVATFVKGGGIGGGNAAEISAAVARFLVS
jgi:hypothetical protein